MVSTSLIAQAAPDMRGKLQKLEGFSGMNITQLIKIASKVYLNREVEADREAEGKMKKKATLMAASLREREMSKRQRKASSQEGGGLGPPSQGPGRLLGREGALGEQRPQ